MIVLFELMVFICAPQISITVADTKLKPKQEIEIKVKTDTESQVGVTCVDQSLLLTKRGNDLTKKEVYNDLDEYDNAGDVDVADAETESFTTLKVIRHKVWN
jgi:hypothetical protein